MALDDTIVATATAPGEAAVAVTRLSGPDAIAIAARHFRGSRSPVGTPTHRILFGRFVAFDGGGNGVPSPGAEVGDEVDTVLLSIFRAPTSYTGEDVVEISSHGGAAAPRAILEALIRSGARPARPGEFTERAFRNGKLDLAQAESVASIVRSRSDRALRAARATLGGDLSRRIEALDVELIGLLAEVESRIDFPGDVRDDLDAREITARLAPITIALRDWLARLPSARRSEEGLRVAIIGAPNVGKSSVLNALVGFDRAIVSDTPGTTRDTVDASVWLAGIELRLTDTAGVRDAVDAVERLGVSRAERAAAGADLVIVVLDATRPSAGAAESARVAAGIPTVVAWNKCDLAPPGAAPADLRPLAVAATVAVRPGGVEPLVGAIESALPHLALGSGADEIPTTSARQERQLAEALASLERAAEAAGGGGAAGAEISHDLLAVDLTEARRALGEVVGRGVDDAVVAAIFERFCIGK